MSHERVPDEDDIKREKGGLRKHLDVMQRITGHAPPTCPWRAMYNSLVREVIEALDHEENGNLAVAIGIDPPAVLVDGIGVFKRALSAVRAEDQRLAYEKAKRERQK